MNKIGLSGHFNIVKKDKYGNVIDEYHFDNLILNSGLDLIGANIGSTSYLDYCLVGSGNSEPKNNQTALDNELMYIRGNGTHNWAVTDEETAYVFTRRFMFNESQANGNIAEIGIGAINSGKKTLFCRTLIKSPNGQPTVITKLQGEILEVNYTLKVLLSTEDNSGVVDIGGKQYRYTARLARRNVSRHESLAMAYDGNIGNVDNQPTGRSSVLSRTFDAYTNGTAKIDVNVSATIDQANFDIRSVAFRGLYDIWWQIQFDAIDDGTAIPKNNTQKLNIVFEQSWGRKNDT